MAPLTEQLVEAAAAATRPTPGLRRAALRTLFDFCGCAVAGADAAAPWLLDRAGRLALSAHLRDQDDLHLGSATHPGGVVWSVVAACALERDATVGDALAAAAFGYELTVRLAEGAGAEHRRHWQVTATAGTVGAAGAAAVLLDPGSKTTANAVAHAVSVAGGSVHAMLERSGTRFVHRAHAASSGSCCARAAAAGVSASRRVLESGRGAFGLADVYELRARLLAPRGATGIEETGFRLYAASGFAHAAIDAALSLGRLEPREIERVRVTVSPPAAILQASNPAPADDEEAWWSIEHAVAVALARGNPDLLASGRGSGEMLDLCSRIAVEGGGSGWRTALEVTLRDGSVRTAAADEPPGHRTRPASDDDLLRKWRRLTGGEGSPFLDRLLSADGDEPFTPLLREGFAGHPAAEALVR